MNNKLPEFDAIKALELAKRIRPVLNQHIHPFLAGRGPEVQSVALADLTATWLAGLTVGGYPADAVEELFQNFIKYTRALIGQNIDMIKKEIINRDEI